LQHRRAGAMTFDSVGAREPPGARVAPQKRNVVLSWWDATVNCPDIIALFREFH